MLVNQISIFNKPAYLKRKQINGHYIFVGSWPYSGLWRSTSKLIEWATKATRILYWDALDYLKPLFKWPMCITLSQEPYNSLIARNTRKHLKGYRVSYMA